MLPMALGSPTRPGRNGLERLAYAYGPLRARAFFWTPIRQQGNYSGDQTRRESMHPPTTQSRSECTLFVQSAAGG